MLDLAVVNGNAANVVAILLGNGDGTFQPHVDYATGTNPQALTAADLDGDGKLDLAIVNDVSPAGSVSILLGNGDGTFAPHVDYGLGDTPQSVTTGDFNGDGKLDLTVPNLASNTVSILLGNGDGTFQVRADYPTGLSPQHIAAGDFDGDGTLDLVVGNFSGNSVSINLNARSAPSQPTNLTAAVQGGPPPAAQSVTLSWTASTSSNVVGYNVYRGTTSGGPYANIASVSAASIGYTDITVVSGTTYYYVVTTVGPGNVQSVNSNEAVAVVP